MFYKWQVNEEKEYKLRLTTEAIMECEEKLGCNILMVLENGMPALKTTLDIIHFSMKKYNAGITRKDLNNIYDEYIENGGTHIQFFTEVFMGVFQKSGFFSEAQVQTMQQAEAKTKKK